MSSKKYFSEKKRETQTITLPLALKERIEKQIEDYNRKVHQEDDGYRSLSSFYCSVMDTLLKLFNDGVTFKDLKKISDREINRFYEKITFKGILPPYEGIIKANKYISVNFDYATGFYLGILHFFQENLSQGDEEQILSIFNRFKNLSQNNKIYKQIYITRIPKLSKELFYHFRMKGIYPNLHFENTKQYACILGCLGIELVKFQYDVEEITANFYVKITDLFYNKKLAKEQRIELLNYNLTKVINFKSLINEKDHLYFFQKMAQERNSVIIFKNLAKLNALLAKIEGDLMKFASRSDFLYTLLKFFKNLHWIEILSSESLLSKELKFEFKLDASIYKEELEFLINYFSKYSKVVKRDGTYFLEKQN